MKSMAMVLLSDCLVCVLVCSNEGEGIRCAPSGWGATSPVNCLPKQPLGGVGLRWEQFPGPSMAQGDTLLADSCTLCCS